jgi:hypothetical protein
MSAPSSTLKSSVEPLERDAERRACSFSDLNFRKRGHQLFTEAIKV